MLTNQIQQELQEMLAADRVQSKYNSDLEIDQFWPAAADPTIILQPASQLDDGGNYFSLSGRVIYPPASLCFSFGISQHMDEINCQPMSRYLAKLYLDEYLLSVDCVPKEQLQLYGMAAIKLSVKVNIDSMQFNETFDYPVATAQLSTGNQYTCRKILEAEHTLLLTLKFKLKITTPYCYIKSIRELVPVTDDTVFKQLELLIEYCAMLPELVGLSSGEIFFAVFLHLCRIKNINQVRHIILALAARWPNIESTAEKIGALFQQDTQNIEQGGQDPRMEIES